MNNWYTLIIFSLQREELEKQQEEEDIAREDRMINQLEKDLFLKKRKSKNLPQSFINDGLDCIFCELFVIICF